MADWFKFYENDLDETRLQYAVSQLPEVIPVWVGILSEACRHKVGTVSWGDDEIELFGFSKRLGVSIPKVNEAIILLEKIRYITRSNGLITVIKWNEKQSEYCQKRTKLQNQTGENHHTKRQSVGTVSGQCRDSVGQEERRGEESREDKTYIQVGSALSPQAVRIGKLFRRKDSTHWSAKELKALKAIEPVTEEDLALIEKYYTAKHPADADYRRRDLQTLLNNWNGEVDRARAFKPKREYNL